MNLLLIEKHELGDDDRVRLGGRRAEHLGRVLKVEVDDTVKVGLIGAGQGVARVVAIDGGRIELEVDVDRRPLPRPDVDLVIGLPRPQALHRVLQFATAMGVGTIHLVNAWRVEKSFFQSPSLEPEKIRRQLWLGAEQGRSTHLPEVRQHKLLVPFLRGLEEGSGEAHPVQRRLLAHPDVPTLIEEAVREQGRAAGARYLLAIGPEGGWIDREVQTFGEVGFEPVRLGPWVLKVEAAVTAALAQLAMARRLSTSGGISAGAC